MVSTTKHQRYRPSGMNSLIRIGYVPEHFLTPVLLAFKHGIFTANGCEVELVPQPSGTGQMITSYREGKIDCAIGLTEGWVNGLASQPSLYRLIGTYVASPLCWAISTGMKTPYHSQQDLRHQTIGVSRIGSGSYVMSFVLADKLGWLSPSEPEPFTFAKLDTFKGLRDGVNSGTAAAFMWERFTTKKYYDSKEIRQIGEIYTPWPSWVITATPKLSKESIDSVLASIDEGIKHYHANHEEAMTLISTSLDYTREDAEEWSKTVTYPKTVVGVEEEMIASTISTLRKAGLMRENEAIQAKDMILV